MTVTTVFAVLKCSRRRGRADGGNFGVGLFNFAEAETSIELAGGFVAVVIADVKRRLRPAGFHVGKNRT